MAHTYRPSLERMNAPHRGATRREDAVNFDLSLMHDLTHIERIAGGNPSFPGHKDDILNNFSALYHEEGPIRSSIQSGGTLVTKIKELDNGIANWSLLNGATRSTQPGWRTTLLSGSLHQAGVSRLVSLDAGDILVFRMKVLATSAGPSQFTLGAKAFNQGDVEQESYDTSTFLSASGKRAGTYIEKRLYSQSKQEVEIFFYVVDGQAGSTTLLLTDFTLSLYQEQSAKVVGIDTSIKRRMNGSSDHLLFLEDRILKQKGEG